MRIAFVTPSLRTLSQDWEHITQSMKLAVPVVSGYLYWNGYRDIRQYDFESEVFDAERATPGGLDLAVFHDTERVERHLLDGDAAIGALCERLCDTLRIEEADVFGFSCAVAVEPNNREVRALMNLALCLARALKERFPGCRTVMGGADLQGVEADATFCDLLDRFPWLDYLVDGDGEVAMLRIVESLDGRLDRLGSEPQVRQRRHGILMKVETAPGPIPLPPARFDSEPRTTQTKARFVTPWYDPRMIEGRRRTGLEILRNHRIPQDLIDSLEPVHDRTGLLLPAMFIRGCNGRCAFCCYSLTMMVNHDIRDVIRTLGWIRETYGTRTFHFLNSNINGFRAFADRFCDAVIDAGLDILWSDSARIGTADDALLEKMRRAGAMRLVWGVECPSDRMLRFVHKGSTREKIVKCLKKSHELGIWNHVQFIAGLPTQTDEDLAAYSSFLEETKDYANAFNVNPYYLDRNSVMYAEAEKYGIRPRPNPRQVDEDAAFDEIDGLAWEEKKVQVEQSTRFVESEIARVHGLRRWSLDLDLLAFLYDTLGHERKADIVRIQAAAFPGIDVLAASRVAGDDASAAEGDADVAGAAVEPEPEPEPEPDPFVRDGDLAARPDAAPALLTLEGLLRKLRDHIAFAGYRVASVGMDRHDDLGVFLRIDLEAAGEPLTLYTAMKRPGTRGFGEAGVFVVAYPHDLSLDVPGRAAAAGEFVSFLARIQSRRA